MNQNSNRLRVVNFLWGNFGPIVIALLVFWSLYSRQRGLTFGSEVYPQFVFVRGLF